MGLSKLRAVVLPLDRFDTVVEVCVDEPEFSKRLETPPEAP